MQLFNALGFSAVFLALAAMIGVATPRRAAFFWLRLGIAGAFVLCAIALPIGLFMLP